jgi:hypothetical protein
MLIDTREPPSDEDGRSGESWLVQVVEWLLPWPALVVWLCAASLLLSGWVAVGCVFAATALALWRVDKLLPRDGLRDYRQ